MALTQEELWVMLCKAMEDEYDEGVPFYTSVSLTPGCKDGELLAVWALYDTGFRYDPCRFELFNLNPQQFDITPAQLAYALQDLYIRPEDIMGQYTGDNIKEDDEPTELITRFTAVVTIIVEGKTLPTSLVICSRAADNPSLMCIQFLYVCTAPCEHMFHWFKKTAWQHYGS